jgi:Zn-dependent protease
VLRLGASPAGILLWGGLYLLLTAGEFLSLAAAVLMHELGHLLALAALWCRIDAVCITGTGLRIDCGCVLSPGGAALAALAGPVFGAVWAFCAGKIGFALSGELSALLTIFNMLPLSPLDGGRALYAVLTALMGSRRARRIARGVDAVLCALLCAFGLYCAWQGLGLGAAATAAWMTLYAALSSCKNRAYGIK